jgi:hypothetical protein
VVREQSARRAAVDVLVGQVRKVLLAEAPLGLGIRTTPRSRGRYAVLPSPRGFAVIDTSAGKPAIFAKAEMVDIDVEDANEVAGILSLRDFRARRRTAGA